MNGNDEYTLRRERLYELLSSAGWGVGPKDKFISALSNPHARFNIWKAISEYTHVPIDWSQFDALLGRPTEDVGRIRLTKISRERVSGAVPGIEVQVPAYTPEEREKIEKGEKPLTWIPERKVEVEKPKGVEVVVPGTMVTPEGKLVTPEKDIKPTELAQQYAALPTPRMPTQEEMRLESLKNKQMMDQIYGFLSFLPGLHVTYPVSHYLSRVEKSWEKKDYAGVALDAGLTAATMAFNLGGVGAFRRIAQLAGVKGLFPLGSRLAQVAREAPEIFGQVGETIAALSVITPPVAETVTAVGKRVTDNDVVSTLLAGVSTFAPTLALGALPAAVIGGSQLAQKVIEHRLANDPNIPEEWKERYAEIASFIPFFAVEGFRGLKASARFGKRLTTGLKQADIAEASKKILDEIIAKAREEAEKQVSKEVNTEDIAKVKTDDLRQKYIDEYTDFLQHVKVGPEGEILYAGPYETRPVARWVTDELNKLRGPNELPSEEFFSRLAKEGPYEPAPVVLAGTSTTRPPQFQNWYYQWMRKAPTGVLP
ncbi:MAG: hypothetical protein ACPL1K_03375, partial [Candidatus Kryptoniota bacterium]